MVHLLLLGLIFPLLSFFFQSYPRFFNKYFGVDVWTRLIEIDHVRRAKHRIPGKITKGFIIDGFFDYPILFPWIFSFFPKKVVLEFQGFVSPFFDAIQNFVVFIICYQLTNNFLMALLSQLIYTLTPIISIENSYLTPRSFGYLNFTLAFYPLLIYQDNHQLLYLFLGFLFSVVLFLSHRFALQSFIFITIFFTFYDRTIIYLIYLAISFLTATLITKGYYLRVAKGHLSNIYFWILNYRYRFSHQVYGLKKIKKPDLVGNIYSLLSSFSPVFLFGLNVWIASGFIYYYLYNYQEQYITKNIIFLKMSVWTIFFYVLAAIVLKVKKLIPIGEGQRYLEMATVPSSILSAIIFVSFYQKLGLLTLIVFFLILLGNLGIILFVQIKGVIKDKNRSVTHELQDTFSYINKLPGIPRIMCIPHQITTMTVYNTKADVLVNADNPQLMTMFDFYPVLKKPIEYLQKKYKLSHLLLRESYAELEDLKMKKPNIIFRSGDVILVKLDLSSKTKCNT